MDIADELERLQQLHRDGVLIDLEFTRAKAAVIDRMRVAVGEPATGTRAPKSVWVFILGFLLLVIGLLMTTVALIGIFNEQKPAQSELVMILLVMLGLIPLGLGSVFCYRYLK